MKLSKLIAPLSFDGADVDITSLSADSRTVAPGTLFAALPGTVLDGRDYIQSAIDNGASAILSTPGLDLIRSCENVSLIVFFKWLKGQKMRPGKEDWGLGLQYHVS